MVAYGGTAYYNSDASNNCKSYSNIYLFEEVLWVAESWERKSYRLVQPRNNRKQKPRADEEKNRTAEGGELKFLKEANARPHSSENG